MRRYKFNKTLVESPNPPKSRDVLWVDIDEPTGKLKTIKGYKNNSWENLVADLSEILPNIKVINKTAADWSNDVEYIDAYVSRRSSSTIKIYTLKQSVLEENVPIGSEFVLFRYRLNDTSTSKVEYQVRWFFVQRSGRNPEIPEEADTKYILIYFCNQYDSGNSDAPSDFDHVWESHFAEYYRPYSEQEGVSFDYNWVICDNPRRWP